MAYQVKILFNQDEIAPQFVLHSYNYDGLPVCEINGSEVTLYDPEEESFNSAHAYCCRVLPFDSGSTDPSVGDVIVNTTHGTGTIVSVSVESGTWGGGDAAGKFYIAYEDSGNNATAEHFTVDNAQIDNDTTSATDIATVVTGQQLIISNLGNFIDTDEIYYGDAIEGGGGVSLTVQDAAVAVASDNVSLTQTHILTVAGATVSVASDNVTIGVAVELVPQDATIAVSADNVSLTQTHTLAVDSIDGAVSADSITLAQTHVLAVDSIGSAVSADGITIVQTHTLTVDAVNVSTSADNVTIEIGSTLLVAQDANVSVTADNLDLVQTHILTVDDMAVSVAADTLSMSEATGMVTISFTVLKPSITFSATKPTITFSATKPTITFTGV